MPVSFENQTVRLEGIVAENDLGDLKSALGNLKPNPIEANMTECKDMHAAAIQMLCAYKINYGCDYQFNDTTSAYQLALEGCRASENDTGQ